MTHNEFKHIENYMLQCMDDAVHDKLHIYRVLNYALRIIDEGNLNVDKDIIIAAALLHDIGRSAESENHSLCHAVVGADMAYTFLKSCGYPEDFCLRVSRCVLTHRKGGKQDKPDSVEAMIIFDADKLDLIGNMGVLRSAIFGSFEDEPIYLLDEHAFPLTKGKKSESPSLIRWYRRKLINLCDALYTKEARKIARRQQGEMNDFFEKLIFELERNHKTGTDLLQTYLN